ncbi:MAG: valine--tRNA ligase [Parcubacteria group bacterium]|nr:valine--tRNA ligase [Parcubacteria group bacterium]
MDPKLLKPYDPASTESRVYKKWEESGYFNPDNLPGDRKEVFTIVMPPPNVTGILHMGHAMMLTVEDIIIRYQRMLGKKTLWIPGTDHAAIATQSKVEKEIYKKEGKNRHDLGREELLTRIRQFAKESHDTIASQIKVIGSSCDWSREAFTLDNKRNLAVNTVFKKMYADGLIYRGHRIVNWDPKGQTTISDDEIVYEERKGILYTFKYDKDFPIAISTTRPETKVGDTAVAVHPDDERYKKYVGKEYDVEFCGVPLHLKIIADKEVDKEFGTGALGVTPAHSQIDWIIAERHDLPKKQVINEFAKMTVGDDRILNKKTTEARAVIVEWLKAEDLLQEEKEVTQNISTAERTGGIVEPLPKLQWFIAVNKEFTKNGKTTTLKKITKEPIEKGEIKIIPDYFSKTYFHWIDNLNDWCISRQIWYGHRIPVWYRSTSLTAGKDDEIYCGIEAPEGEGWKQDEDTLDTWFSSALWTFSTLGWPEKTKDLETYHPTDVLETGYEIIFFWVARMIMMTEYNLGTIPFKNVYFHGTVRDAKGRRMSKSLGNGMDPIEVANKFGMDAGRMALVVGTAPGTDSKISEDKIKGYKHFANKIWNITRFVLSSTTDTDLDSNPTLEENDEKIINELNKTIEDVTADLDNYRFYMASEKIYHYIWHTFADIIIEESKPILSGDNLAQKTSRQWTLLYTLKTSLKILHPFMPFITEEIWSMMPKENETMLMVESWPKTKI